MRSLVGTPVVVYWDDAILRCGSDDDTSSITQVSYGVFHEANDKDLVIAHSVNSLGRDDRLTIPRGMVKRIVRVNEGSAIRKW